MLQPDHAQLFRQSEQEVVMVIMMGAEQSRSLFDEVLMGFNLLRRCIQGFCIVCNNIERDRDMIRPGQIKLTEIPARINRGVDQRIIGRCIEVGFIAIGRGAQSGANLPSMRHQNAWLDRNIPREIPSWI